MDIIESEAHRGQYYSTRGESGSKQVCLKLFLEGIWRVEHDVTESGREFQMVGPADLNPREPNTVLTSGTVLMCTRRAKGTQRNIGMNEGWQIWWGYGVEWLKSQEGNFEVNPSRDWKPVERFQKGGCAGPRFGTRNNTSQCILSCMYAR